MSEAEGNVIPKKNWRSMLDLATTVIMLVAASILIWRATTGASAKKSPPPAVSIPSVPVSIAGAAIKGSRETRAVMIEFSDFQCPFCGKFSREILPTILKGYVENGKVAIVFRHLPLGIHSEALGSAIAATCAGETGHFWDMHNLLFGPKADLTELGRTKMAASLGLPDARFKACVGNSTAKNIVESDMALAKALGVSGTPAFLFGVLNQDRSAARIQAVFAGARPISEFTAALDGIVRTAGQ